MAGRAKRAGKPASDLDIVHIKRSGDRRYTESLSRGLSVLRCFTARNSKMTHQEIVHRTGLPKATVSRLIYTLTELGYLTYSAEAGTYGIGTAVLSLGFSCLNGMSVRNIAQPHMQALAEHAGPGILVALGARDEFGIVYLACSRSSGLISLLLNVGSRVSLARSAVGRAYISALPEDERATLMAQLRERAGDKWPQQEDGILRSIEEIRERGFCINLGEWQPDVHSIAVPFRSPQPDEPLLAFNCGGPSYLLKPDRLVSDLGPRLVDLVQKVRFNLTPI